MQYTRTFTGGILVTANIEKQPDFGDINNALTNNEGVWFSFTRSGVKHIIKADQLDISLYTNGFVSKYVKAVVNSDNQQENGFVKPDDNVEPDTAQFNGFWDMIPTEGRTMGDIICKSLLNGLLIKNLGEPMFNPIDGTVLPDSVE